MTTEPVAPISDERLAEFREQVQRTHYTVITDVDTARSLLALIDQQATALRDIDEARKGAVVKPLEWVEVLPDQFQAMEIGLKYVVVGRHWWEGDGRVFHAESTDEAKAAAQADFESRIRSALLPSLPAEQEDVDDGVGPVVWRYRLFRETQKWTYETRKAEVDCRRNANYEIEALYSAAQPPAFPNGWKLVPAEPTEAMLDAADRSHALPERFITDIYRAMVAESPAVIRALAKPASSPAGGDVPTDLATRIMALDWKARKDWTVDEQADRHAEIQEMIEAALSPSLPAKGDSFVASARLDGWKLVPVEPTDDMDLAGGRQVDRTNPYDRDVAGDVYAAMLSAAPTPPNCLADANQNPSAKGERG